MIVEIKSRELTVKVNTLGAELESIKQGETERLWQRNELWPRQSPVMFPMIGKTKDDYYTINGEKYIMDAVHGFARTSEFEVVNESKTDTFVELRLKSSEETLKIYPYNFELLVAYEVKDNKISTKWVVKNLDSKEMYFTIGGHPGFKYDIGNGEGYLDYIVKFDEPIEYKVYGVNDSLISDAVSYSEVKKSFFQMNDLCKKHTIVIFDKVDNCTLVSNTGHSIRIDCPNVPLLAFWQNNLDDPKFLCLEPWCGLPDYVDSTHEFEKKKTNIKLPVDGVYENGYSITID